MTAIPTCAFLSATIRRNCSCKSPHPACNANTGQRHKTPAHIVRIRFFIRLSPFTIYSRPCSFNRKRIKSRWDIYPLKVTDMFSL